MRRSYGAEVKLLRHIFFEDSWKDGLFERYIDFKKYFIFKL